MNRKKIILVVIDALRADHLGCYGYKRNTSPNLDKLAKENILFKWAFSTISYTCPSFASILTSLYPSYHSIGFHQKFPKLDKDKDILISEILKSLNLSTIAVIGSMPLRKEIGLNSGFDIYDADIPEGRRSAEEINEKFFDWLDNNYKNDFFALIHYFDTHLPFNPPQPYDKEFLNDEYYGDAKYLDVISDGWGGEGEIPQIGGIPRSAVLMNDGNIEKDIRYYISQYDGCIKYVDSTISAVIEKLKKLNIYDDCLLIITADHGEAMGENNVWFYHSLTVTPDQIHVPLIMKFPKDLAINPTIYYNHVSLIDIMPTILDLVDFEFKDLSLQGKSLLKLIKQGYDKEIEDRTIIAENEGQIANIDRETIKVRPKYVDKNKLVFLYVEELCNKEMTLNYHDNKKMLEWSGERFLPWIEGSQIHYEHFHRYAFAVQFVKGKKVLDLPCGEGYGSNMLSKEAEYVAGIDIDEQTINHARNKYTAENLEFFQGSILEIPIQENEKFDVIICFEGLEHIEEHEMLLSEVKRLLKKDGLFIVSTPNKEEYSDEANFNNPFHKKELYFIDFVQLLKNHFKNPMFFGQKVYGSSNIWPLTQDSHSGYKEFLIEKNDKEFNFSDTGKKNPLYFIAIASDKILDKKYFENSNLIDVSDSLIKDFVKQISGLSRDMKAKDTQLTELSNVIQGKDTQLTELNNAIQSSNIHIANLSNTLQSMQQSMVWQLLMKFQRMIDYIFPQDTKRGKYYNLGLIYGRIAMKDGLRSSWQKYKDDKKVHNTLYKKNIKIPKLDIKIANSLEDIETIQKDVSIIIPAKNAGSDFEFTLEKIRAQKGIKHIELIIIDSGSTDETIRIADKFGSKVFTIKSEDFNHGETRNFGAKKATGDYILFMVQDAIPIGDRWLHNIVKVLESDEKIAAVTCRQVPRSDADIFSCWAMWFHYKFLDMKTDKVLYLNNRTEYDSLSPFEKRKLTQLDDVCACYRKEIFDEFKFKAISFAEDLELGMRLIKTGHKLVFLYSSGVIHSHNRSPSYHIKRSYIDSKTVAVLLDQKEENDFSSVEKIVTANKILYKAIVRSVKIINEDSINGVNEFASTIKSCINIKAHSPKYEKLEGEKSIDKLFVEIETIFDKNSIHKYNENFNFINLDYISRLDAFISYPSLADLSFEHKKEEFIAAIYKLYANMFGESLGKSYTYCNKKKCLDEKIIKIDALLSKEV